MNVWSVTNNRTDATHWCDEERGTCDRVVEGYGRRVRSFISEQRRLLPRSRMLGIPTCIARYLVGERVRNTPSELSVGFGWAITRAMRL